MSNLDPIIADLRRDVNVLLADPDATEAELRLCRTILASLDQWDAARTFPSAEVVAEDWQRRRGAR